MKTMVENSSGIKLSQSATIHRLVIPPATAWCLYSSCSVSVFHKCPSHKPHIYPNHKSLLSHPGRAHSSPEWEYLPDRFSHERSVRLIMIEVSKRWCKLSGTAMTVTKPPATEVMASAVAMVTVSLSAGMEFLVWKWNAIICYGSSPEDHQKKWLLTNSSPLTKQGIRERSINCQSNDQMVFYDCFSYSKGEQTKMCLQ